MVKIGNWVRRSKAGRKWHLVESVVAEDAFTKCGRRLNNEAGLMVSPVEPLTRMIGQPQNCQACSK